MARGLKGRKYLNVEIFVGESGARLDLVSISAQILLNSSVTTGLLELGQGAVPVDHGAFGTKRSQSNRRGLRNAEIY